jgi:hypothetical protein
VILHRAASCGTLRELAELRPVFLRSKTRARSGISGARRKKTYMRHKPTTAAACNTVELSVAGRLKMEQPVAAPVRTQMRDVEHGIAKLRQRGVTVAWRAGRIIGLRALRELVGGDAGRVRAMAVVCLQRERGGIDGEELHLAQARLGVQRGVRSPLAGLSRSDSERVLGLLANVMEHAVAALAPNTRDLDAGRLAPHTIRNRDLGTAAREEQPAAPNAEAASNGARQNATSGPAPGVLSALLEEKRRQELPALEVNPFILDRND